jgi:methionyl-tRNA synthetase
LLVTTPIYYVNAAPHIGHAYTSLAADVLSRYYRLAGGERPRLLTGTDEHGEKVALNAAASGLPPQEFADRVAADFRRLLEAYNVENDDFVRTTEPRHKAAAGKFWEALAANGHVYKGKYEGWYAVRDECYYSDSELVEVDGEKRAPTGAEVVYKEKEEVRRAATPERDEAWTRASLTPPHLTLSSNPPPLPPSVVLLQAFRLREAAARLLRGQP